MSIFSKKDKNEALLKTFDGREVKYVTKRVKKQDGSYEHVIVGKSGRIAVVGENIRIICGEKDIFTAKKNEAVYFLLMSGDGVTVEGRNAVTGRDESITAYYTYYRK